MADPVAPRPVNELDRRIVNSLQGGFPISDRPYAEVARDLGVSETELIGRIEELLRNRVLTRFGPLFNAERMGGAVTLAAMRVPPAEFERVTAQVNAFPQVAHNYERDHELNMWFVLATETAQGISQAIADIEAATGLPVYDFPKLDEFYIGLKLEV